MLGVLNKAEQWASRSVQYLQSKDNHSGQSFLGFVVYWLEKTDVFSMCSFYFSLTFPKKNMQKITKSSSVTLINRLSRRIQPREMTAQNFWGNTDQI